jgi:hypothetical protein
MIRPFALAAVMLLPLAATAQAVAPPPVAPVEHRLTPDEIAAAQADGDRRNRAAELLAMTRGEPSLALPGEKTRKWHGTAEIAIGTNGYREIGGEVSTQLGETGSLTIAGQYGAYNNPYRQRARNR